MPTRKVFPTSALGDIYYNIPEYSLAQAYYDSTIQNIDKDYEDYRMPVETKSRSLTNLVTHLRVYTLEDSLADAGQSAGRSEAGTESIRSFENVRKKEEEERLQKQEEMQNNQFGMDYEQEHEHSSNQGGKWYFYNLNAKGFGQPEFRMRWGNRKLEDNWRRNNKQTLEFVEQSQESAGNRQHCEPEKRNPFQQ